MTDYRAQVILRTADAIPANFVTNSFAFATSDDSPANTDEFTVAVKDFYDDMIAYLPSLVAQNGHMIKYTALPGTPPNYPFEEDTFNLASAPSTDPLPSEVSLVMSFQGSRQAGFPQSRRRGRIYFGPIRAVGSAGGRPTAPLIAALALAGTTFKSNVAAITGGTHNWTVWSHADQLGVVITNGWVDNAFDTQRRRGVGVTSRTTFV